MNGGQNGDGGSRAETREPALLAAYEGLAPGWYRDRDDPSRARYWDGATLSSETRQVVPERSPASAQAPASPPAGWYREKGNLTTARYWDGSTWTDQTRPVPPSEGADASEAPIQAPAQAETQAGSHQNESSAEKTAARGTSPSHARHRGSHARRKPLYEQAPFWIVCGLLVLVVVGVVITQATKSPKSKAADSTTQTTTPTTTVNGSSTTVTAPTTTVPVPVAPQPTAEGAATALVSNWASGNKAVALRVATPHAVDTLFGVAYPSGLAVDRGCSDGSPPITCTFGPPGGANPSDAIYSLLVSRAPDGDWYVSSVQIEG